MARQKLIETFQKDWQEAAPIKKLPLKESAKIIESNGDTYNVLGAYKVPVWRLDKRNLNERVYSTKLAEKVIEQGKITVACDSHMDEPKYEDVKAVGKNPTIEDGIMWVECSFVDEAFHKKAERLIEAGAGLGLSSSAWGDQDSNGNILEEGFEIDRYFDFVLDPSYEVYMTKETKKEDVEKTESDNNKISESKTDKKKEVKSMGMKNLSLEEKNLKIGVQSLVEKAEKVNSVKEKISAYRDVIDYCDGIDTEFAVAFTEDAQNAIADLENSLFENVEKVQEAEKQIEEKGKTLEEQTSLLAEAEQKLTSMQEKYEVAVGMVDDFTVREDKLKEMVEVLKAEKNGMVKANDFAEMTAYIESLEEEVATIKKDLRKLKNENSGLKEENEQLHIMASEYQETVEGENKRRSLEKRKARLAMMQKMREEEAEGDAEKDDDKEGEEEDDKEEKKGKKKGESYYDLPGYEGFTYDSLIDGDDAFRDVEGITEYYEDLEAKDPSVRKIKKEIMRCKTVLEAQQTYMNLYDLIVDKASKPAIRKTEQFSQKSKAPKFSEPSVKKVLHKGWV